MTKVFVPQIPTRRNEKGIFVPKHDLTPAEVYGTIVPVLRPGNLRDSDLAGAHRTVIDVLDREFHDGDYLLLMGDPVAIAMVVSCATGLTDVVRILKYDRVYRKYNVQPFDVTY